MKLLVIFASAILCAQAIQVPYTIIGDSYESSEEEYRIYIPNRDQRTFAPFGVGGVQQPIIEAVKIKVPRYASPEVKKLLLTQALAARGLTLQDFAPRDVGSVTHSPVTVARGQRQIVSTVNTLAVVSATGSTTTTPVPAVVGLLGVTNKSVVAAPIAGVNKSGAQLNVKQQFRTEPTKERSMQVLLIFVAALLLVQAVRVPYIIPDSSEEEYHVLLPTHSTQEQLDLTGLGLIKNPILQAVKVKVPRYADPWLKRQLIQQFLAPHGLTLQEVSRQTLSGHSVRAQSFGTHRQPVQDFSAQNHGLQGITTHGLGPQASSAQVPSTQGLHAQSLNIPNLNTSSASAQNLAAQDLLVRNLLLQNPKNQGWGYLNIDVPNAIVQSIELRSRRHVEEGKWETSTTAATLDTTTVPDVTEITTTITELPEKENDNKTSDSDNTQSDTKANNKRETSNEPFIPLFGFGSFWPAEISRVGFAPRIPLSSSATIAISTPTTEAPSKLYAKRSSDKSSFNVKGNKEITKVTPVPPVPQIDTRAPKITDFPRLHTHPVASVGKSGVESSTKKVELASTTQKNCDIECTKLQYNPVCAFNGECYHEFPNQCVMDTFVCKRPDLGFKLTPREQCEENWLHRCSEVQLKTD
ncbi:uncharacterized protein [Eurosta solidaginis]|uniref:uncharacterized protein n=1 Tax=Eurosta solidaginis TaxID=178769 RepID=UPI003530D08E